MVKTIVQGESEAKQYLQSYLSPVWGTTPWFKIVKCNVKEQHITVHEKTKGSTGLNQYLQQIGIGICWQSWKKQVGQEIGDIWT